MKRRKRGLVIITDGGSAHRIYEAFPLGKLVGKRVKDGQVVGEACCTTIRYRWKGSDGKLRDAMRIVNKPVDNPKPKPKRTLWMPNVRRNRAWGAGDMGTGGGSERKVVWHTTESGHDAGAIHWLDDYIKRNNSSYHLLWNPWTGQFCQLYAADVGARSLKNASSPYLATNRHGNVCIQVSIVGKASERPLAGGSPLKGRARLMDWLDAWDIPHRNLTTKGRDRTEFKRSGHSAHKNAPGNDHYDPGAILFSELWNG